MTPTFREMLDRVNAIVPVALSVIGVLCFIAGALILVLRAQNSKGAATRAGLLAGVGAVALVLTRLPDITLFAALGMRAELRQTIDEANAKIAQLRSLALAIAEPELSQMAMSGVLLSNLPFSYQYERKKHIVETLKSLGIPQDDITHAEEPWTSITLLKLSNVIASALVKSDNTLLEKFDKMRADASPPDRSYPIKPEVLRDFMHANRVTNKDVMELVDDYEHLYKTGEVRRPEVFPPGLQPYSP
jgi:hypothetical protein